MKFTNILFSLTAILLFIACEKEIDTNFGNLKPQLVINSVLTTDTTFEVQVSCTSPMPDTTYTLIDNARVELWMDGKIIENLNYVGEGLYKSQLNKPIPGHNYKLVVNAQGFTQIEAIDSIPFPVNIIDSYYVFPAGTDVSNEQLVEFNVSFNDPAETINYYELVIYTKDTYYDYYGTQDTITSVNYYYDFITDDPIFKAEGDMDYHPVTLFFCDKLFNGEKTNIAVKTLSGGSGTVNGVPFISGQYKITELRSISYSYYQYLKKWTRHHATQGIDMNIQSTDEFIDFLYMGEPVNMYTNVTNGYGIFAGFSKSDFNIRNESKK